MHRHDGNTPASPTTADASAGGYLIPELHFRKLEAMRDDLLLLATLAACADPDRHADGLSMKTLASNTQRAVCVLDNIVVSARWLPKEN